MGDSSSDFLFQALHATGFASDVDPSTAALQGARITNVVKCLPPQNQPTREEEQNCSDHLQAELAEFWSPRVRAPRVLVSLGGVAHRALWRSLPAEITQTLSCPKFSHNARSSLAKNLFLVSSFHPSKLNTQTGRLTQSMLQDVLMNARETLGVR